MINITTKLLSATVDGIAEAGRLLGEGKTVIIPTETVYGLAANALDADAVAKIFAAKGRPQDNPLIVHVASLAQAESLVSGTLPENARLLAASFWPGPLTMILPRSSLVPASTAGGLDTVAIRMPAHPVALAVIEAAGVPLAAPSANRSGSPSPTTATHCVDDMSGRVSAVLDGGDCSVGVESTVVTLCTGPPRLLRPGAVTLEQLAAVLGAVEVDKGVTEHLDDSVRVSSPGMKYKHYSPTAQVILLAGDSERYCDYCNNSLAEGDCAVCFDEELSRLAVTAIGYGNSNDHDAQAARLFSLLRELDSKGYSRAFVHAPATDGVGLAVYNRLIRAAGFDLRRL